MISPILYSENNMSICIYAHISNIVQSLQLSIVNSEQRSETPIVFWTLMTEISRFGFEMLPLSSDHQVLLHNKQPSALDMAVMAAWQGRDSTGPYSFCEKLCNFSIPMPGMRDGKKLRHFNKPEVCSISKYHLVDFTCPRSNVDPK